MKISVIFLFCIFSGLSLATPAQRNVPIPIIWGKSLESLPTATLKSYEHILQMALGTVAHFPPVGQHIFDWKDQALIQGKQIYLLVQHSRDEVLFPSGAKIPKEAMPATKDTDAFTTIPINPQDKSMLVLVTVLWDRLFYTQGGIRQNASGIITLENPTERPDGFARLMIALAHEFYGNVQGALEMKFEDAKPMTFAMRKESEIRAFNAGITFIERVQRHELFHQLPPKTRKGLEDALVREKEGLKSWEHSSPPNTKCSGKLMDQ